MPYRQVDVTSTRHRGGVRLQHPTGIGRLSRSREGFEQETAAVRKIALSESPNVVRYLPGLPKSFPVIHRVNPNI
jgi:hypothetical protein